MLGNVPHDWLFTKVSAVVHHGGAGTTAIGLRLGRPTVIVPFFGDQAFWARMVYAAGAGPEPQPFKTLTAEKLANAIKVALAPDARTAAANLAERMADEHGAETAAKSFHRMLPLKNMRCSVFPKKLAVWRVRRTGIIISSFVAIVLLEHKALKANDLKPYAFVLSLLIQGALTGIMTSMMDPLIHFQELQGRYLPQCLLSQWALDKC
jgi:UDP-glucoronosyl and UDP-glucosyl transferase